MQVFGKKVIVKWMGFKTQLFSAIFPQRAEKMLYLVHFEKNSAKYSILVKKIHSKPSKLKSKGRNSGKSIQLLGFKMQSTGSDQLL